MKIRLRANLFPARGAAVSLAIAVTAALPNAASAVADQFVYYFGNTTSTGSGAPQLGGYSYNPTSNTFYTAGLSGAGQALGSVTNSGSGFSFSYNVGQTDWLNFLKDSNVSTGTQVTNASATNPTSGGLLLNPTTLVLGGITYAPDTVGIILNGANTFSNSTLDPTDSKLVYAYDLRAVTYGSDFNYNAVAAPGTRDYNGDGIIEGNDVFYPIVSLADQQSVNPGVSLTNGSNSVARQFAFSSNGQSIYFTDASSAYGGLYKVNLTSTGSSAISKILSTTSGLNSEPAVIKASVRNLGSGSTGDQILFAGTTDTGNLGGVNYVLDTGTSVTTTKVAVSAKQIAAFNDYTGLLETVQSMTADSAGNLYIEQNYATRYGGIFEVDTTGRMAKVFSGAEQAYFDQANNVNYNAIVLKPQIVTVGSTPQLQYKDFGLQSPVGVNLYTPGDFNHDGVINATDISAFKAHLGLRGAVSGTISPTSSGSSSNTDYFAYDLNGSYGTNSGTNILTASVDWKDAQIFCQYAGLSYGDVNMDGSVNQTDFNTLASNYNADGKIWTQGNITSVRINAVDKDMVNYADMVTLAANYPAGTKPVITGYGSAVQTDADRAFAVTANGTISQLTATNFAGGTINWADAGNWSNGVPNSAGAVASLLTKPLNDTTLNIAASETVGQLNFDSYFTYTLSGTGTLHLAGNNGTTAEINTFAASPLISTAVSLDSATNVTITYSSDTATFSGSISGSGTFTKLGAGTVYFTGTNSYTGATTVSAGSLQTVNAAALPGYNTSGKISVLSGGTLVANAGGMIEWTGTDLDTLRSKAAFSAGSFLGINTTNAAGQFTYASNITGALALNKLGSNTLFLSGTNSYSGGTVVNAGVLDASIPASLPGYSTAGQLTANSGGTLAVAVGTAHWSSTNVATLLSNATLNTGSFLGLDTTFAATGFTYAGNIAGNSGVAKLGANTLTLTGSNTYMGATAIAGGTLQLSFSGGATTSNILPATTALILSNNGGLTVTGVPNSSTALSQSFNTSTGVTVASGSAAVVLNDYSTSAGAPLTVSLGQLNRSIGSTVDFTLPTGSQSSLLSSASTSNNIIGGWATVGQTDWASIASNAVIPLPGYSYTNDTWNGNYNTTVTGSSSPSAASSTYSLRFNASGAYTVALSGVNTISSGGILITPNVGANISTITGGTLTGTTGKDLIVNQFNTAGIFTIGSVIADATTSTGLTKSGGGTLNLTAANTYTGATFVNAGQLQISSGSLASTNINVLSGATLKSIPLAALPTMATVTTLGTVNLIGNGATSGGPAALTLAGLAIGNGGLVTVADRGTANRANRTLLVTSNLIFAGGSDSWNGTLDLASNDMLVHGDSLANLTNQVRSGFAAGNWNGSGVTSSTAHANTSHLTSLGVIANNDGSGNLLYGSGTSLGLFDGANPASTDLLVKYTYYGDANLSGKVDASDYSRIDSGYLTHAIGWFNGDFNYDGVINGSDYTLIDNAFNTQGAGLTAEIASPQATPTAQVAGATAVPEPTAMCTLGIAALGMLGRKRRR